MCSTAVKGQCTVHCGNTVVMGGPDDGPGGSRSGCGSGCRSGASSKMQVHGWYELFILLCGRHPPSKPTHSCRHAPASSPPTDQNRFSAALRHMGVWHPQVTSSEGVLRESCSSHTHCSLARSAVHGILVPDTLLVIPCNTTPQTFS